MELHNDVGNAQRGTGVEGLDEVLGGGLRDGGICLIEGDAGVGKTVLTSQMCFHRARAGQRVLYVTLVAESHAGLLGHLSHFAFYDARIVGETLTLISGYEALSAGGLDGLLQFLARQLSERRPSLLAIDGFQTAVDFGGTRTELGRFLHELRALVSAAQCLALLLVPEKSGARTTPVERMLVDGVIRLTRLTRGMRSSRELEVVKLRGAAHIEGRNTFSIGDDGVRVYPRLEARSVSVRPDPARSTRLKFGIGALDAMLHGGLIQSSVTSVLGAPGTGKTLVGIHFLHAGIQSRERGLYFGFYESPERLLAKARAVSLDLQPHAREDSLQFIWQAPGEYSLDWLADRLLQEVRRHDAKRLMIDGIGGLRDTSEREERFGLFLTALMHELRRLGVTTLIANEMPLYGDGAQEYQLSDSAILENVISLRYLQRRSRIYRLITVVKLRESGHDLAPHEFRITAAGLEVARTSDSAERILNGDGAHEQEMLDPDSSWLAP
jgi:circadian clock protein KaiC